MTDEDVQVVVLGEARKRHEAADSFTAAGRLTEAATKAATTAVLERYLPAVPTVEEIARVAVEVIDEAGFSSMRDMGAAVQATRERLGPLAPGGEVAAAVRRVLS